MKADSDLHGFRFREIHPKVFIGTASDRYAGWIGQIYTEDRYRDRLSLRTKVVKGRTFRETVLPVESVEEYFEHFSVLELDFTFYRLLKGNDQKPTQAYHVLKSYQSHLRKDARLLLKVPQAIFSQRLWRGGKSIENPDYLNPDVFINHFYEPAAGLLGDLINGFIFEQEYRLKRERGSPDEHAAALGEFFDKIPGDERYHIELRTEPYLSHSYFKVLERYGLGQVLSHWTWLQPLRTQFKKSNGSFFSASKQCIIRLVTPLRMGYEETYIRAYPFDKMIDGMMSQQMVEDTVEITRGAISQGISVNVVVNNRAGGNAPIIAQRISKKLIETHC